MCMIEFGVGCARKVVSDEGMLSPIELEVLVDYHFACSVARLRHPSVDHPRVCVLSFPLFWLCLGHLTLLCY